LSVLTIRPHGWAQWVVLVIGHATSTTLSALKHEHGGGINGGALKNRKPRILVSCGFAAFF
jgi:hypothetical protein